MFIQDRYGNYPLGLKTCYGVGMVWGGKGRKES